VIPEFHIRVELIDWSKNFDPGQVGSAIFGSGLGLENFP